MDGEYIYRFELDLITQTKSKEPLIDFLKLNLKEILNLVTLTFEGNVVKVDGFRLVYEDEKTNRYIFDEEG